MYKELVRMTPATTTTSLSRAAIRAINALEGIPPEVTDQIFDKIDAMRAEGLTRDQIRERIKQEYQGGKKD